MPGIAAHSPYSQPLGSPGGRQLDLEFISSFLLDAAVSYPNCLVQGGLGSLFVAKKGTF